jgi:uncharacterized membrane protein
MALLSLSVLADGVGWLHGSTFFWQVSFWVVVAGLAAALPTASAGLIDYAAIPEGHAAAHTGTTHMLLMLTAVACFIIDLLVRGGSAAPQGAARIAVVALDLGGATLLLLGGWYGGELVFGHGIGRGESAQAPAARAQAGESRRLGP